MDGPLVGQIWREVDPRFTRFVRIESVPAGGAYLVVGLRTVVSTDGGWETAPRSRTSYADVGRFNGKRGNYAFHEQPAALSQAEER